MCSICGIIDFKNVQNAREFDVTQMSKTLTHRGPDQSGTYYADGVSFAHNRLSIMDIENGIQPMSVEFEGKKYTIIYNGEIYNWKELSLELQNYGVRLKTKCDTEVVLYTYIIFKEMCAEKLNGIFAFAVYDDDKKLVYIARDRFGIKPLFYAQVGSTIYFASEIKALLKCPNIQPDVDRFGLWQLLYLSPVKLRSSGIFKQISEMVPAHFGIFDQSGFHIKKYWELKAAPCTETRADILENTRFLLEDSIKRQLISDAPLCCFLSGGLDSSIISSIAAKQYQADGRRLTTYSFEYENNKKNFKHSLFQPQGDDLYATYLADYLGTKHHILTAKTSEVADLLQTSTEFRDMPGQSDIDSSLLFYCSKVKERHTVAISGECADEIFGGYPWFYRKEMLENGFFPWIHNPFARINLFDDTIVHAQEGFDWLQTVYENSMEKCPILDTDSADMKQSRLATWLSVRYFMTSLLERKDRMSMANGVEVRVPFSDHRILEYVYNVPWDIKFEGKTEKALLRNAMSQYLPKKILNRKKSPYPKTHDPNYEKTVVQTLQGLLSSSSSPLSYMIDKTKLEELLLSENATWFGQLMSKPQLIAWLIQFDFWMQEYHVNIVD